MPLFTTLPYEILYHIISYLADDDTPSLKVLHREPTLALTYSKETPLKTISATCSLFRALTLPLLFKFTRVHLGPLSLLWSSYGTGHGPDARTLEIKQFLDFLGKNSLSSGVHGMVFYTEHAFGLAYPGVDNENSEEEPHWLWRTILSVVSPRFITICAPPITLGRLIGCKVNTNDAWAFDMPLHILHLSRPSTANCPINKECQDLFTIMPWTRCTLNEGSSCSVYNTYEYYHKRSPSILEKVPNLVLAERRLGLQSLEYIAIFPPAKHAYFLFPLIASCPYLEHLSIQLAPHPADGILEDDRRIHKASLSDMWMEHKDFETQFLSVMTRGAAAVFKQPLCLALSDSTATYLRKLLELYDNNSLNRWEESSDGRIRMKDGLLVLNKIRL